MITKRVGAGWKNWKKCIGVVCDRRMEAELNGEVYKKSDQASNMGLKRGLQRSSKKNGLR